MEKVLKVGILPPLLILNFKWKEKISYIMKLDSILLCQKII